MKTLAGRFRVSKKNKKTMITIFAVIFGQIARKRICRIQNKVHFRVKKKNFRKKVKFQEKKKNLA